MSDASALVSSYLLPAGEACWIWARDAGAVTFTGGQLMALRAELDVVLARLEPGGLPPFGAILLLLAASQDGWADPGGGREQLGRYVAHVLQTCRPAPKPPAGRLGIRVNMRRSASSWGRSGSRQGPLASPESLPVVRLAAPSSRSPTTAHRRNRAATMLTGSGLAEQVLDGLDRVHALPPRLRSTLAAKAVLAEMAFEPARERLSEMATAAVLHDVQRGANPMLLSSWPPEKDGVTELAGDLEALRDGLAALSEERVALRLRTGLDATPQPAQLEVPPGEQVRALLTELLSDKELAGLARLSMSLVAAIHVPRPLVSTEELQQGGVSDLSNRGPLDRLLVSELAHDDLTLAVRIAANEALYLRREAPPRTPPSRRAILLDSGIRLWGVPRLFATAVALALAASCGKGAALEAYRPMQDSVHPVELTTKEGLMSHLEALDAAPHPGPALAGFLHAASRSGEPTEMVIVTHADTLADPGFRAAVAALERQPVHVATVDRDGSFRLLSDGSHGQKLICQATLDLECLGASPRRPAVAAQLLLPERAPALPAILSLAPFPLRVPQQIRWSHARASGRHGVVSLTEDGRLLHWQDPAFGPMELTALVPAGPLHGLDLDSRGVARAVVGRASGNRIPMLLAELATGRVTRVELAAAGATPRAVFVQSGAVILVSHGRADAFEQTSGDRLASFEALSGGCRWVRGRFFRAGGDWFALTFDGTSLALDPLARSVTGPPVALFDREGLDGPWALTAEGEIVSTVDWTFLPMEGRPPGPWRVVTLSSDGHKLVCQSLARRPRDVAAPAREVAVALERAAGSTGRHLFDLTAGRCKPLVGDPWQAVEAGPAVDPAMGYLHDLRSRFRAVMIGEGGELILESRKGVTASFALNESGRLLLRPYPARPGAWAGRVAFTPVAGPPGTRYRLQAAAWRDGSKLFLDSRGLLHFKSAQRALPEMTLVLSQSALAGWASDGRMFGLDYYTGGRQRATAADFFTLIDRFTAELLDHGARS